MGSGDDLGPAHDSSWVPIPGPGFDKGPWHNDPLGPMIGIQDESTGNDGNADDATVQVATESMDDSASIMSGGEAVEEAHHASVVAAINQAVLPHNVTFSIK